jgi:aminocarboxymuconate-semialdehyde decarboxylase
VLGSDFPFDKGVTDPVQRVRAAGLGDAATDLVLGGNTAVLTLLPISTPEPQPRTTA